MIKLTLIEFFLRIIPEMFIMIWGIHVISRKSIDMPKYIFSSILSAILIFFVRWLPIYFGIHTIINIILIVSIMVMIDIPLIKAIYSSLLITFIFSLSEFVNIMILKLMNMSENIYTLTPIIKCVYGIPSLLFISLFIIMMNYLLKMKETIKNVSN